MCRRRFILCSAFSTSFSISFSTFFSNMHLRLSLLLFPRFQPILPPLSLRFCSFCIFFSSCPCAFAPSALSPSLALLLLQTSRRFDGNNDLFSELLYGFFLGERGRVQYWKSPTICECSVPPEVPKRLLFSYSYIWPLVEQTSSISFADIR